MESFQIRLNTVVDLRTKNGWHVIDKNETNILVRASDYGEFVTSDDVCVDRTVEFTLLNGEIVAASMQVYPMTQKIELDPIQAFNTVFVIGYKLPI